ncbi:MAG: hypothetical protein Q3983_09595 [Capnocytophaga sp.]|nr:hypothetical protein [Capnocytophaga sp.]
MFYTITNKYTPYKEITTSEIVCPLSGEIEPMKLVLHQLLVDSIFTKHYSKKPFGVYFRISDKKDIPASYWTEEMEAFFEEQKAISPVPNKGWKFSTFGKIFIGLAIFILLMISWKVFEAVAIEPFKKQNAFAELTKLPQVGDQYKIDFPTTTYDANGKATAKGVTPIWVEILQVSPDSTCVFVPIEPISKDKKIENYALEQQQEDGTFVGKFKVLDKDKITFLTSNATYGFDARTYGNIENVKRKK